MGGFLVEKLSIKILKVLFISLFVSDCFIPNIIYLKISDAKKW